MAQSPEIRDADDTRPSLETRVTDLVVRLAFLALFDTGLSSSSSRSCQSSYGRFFLPWLSTQHTPGWPGSWEGAAAFRPR